MKINLIIALLLILFLIPHCILSAEYFKGVLTNDLNHNFFTNGFVYQNLRNNNFTPTNTLDWNTVGKLILSSNGDDYINTGVVPDTTSTKRTHVQIYGRFKTLAGFIGKWSEPGSSSKFAFGISTGKWLAAKANSNPLGGNADTYLHLFDYNYDGLWVDENRVVDLSAISASVTANRTFHLYANIGNDGNVSSYSNFELHYAKIYDSGNLIRNFIPQENGCLFDLVNLIEYCNQGVGDLEVSTTADISQDVIAYYKLDSSSTTNITDSARGRTATLVNEATINSPGMWDSNALFLDGNNDYVNLNRTFEEYYNVNKTSCAWIRTNNSTSEMRIFNYGYLLAGSTVFGIGINKSSPGTAYFQYKFNNTASWINSTTIVTDNQWHRICASVDNNTVKLFVDGNLESSAQGIDVASTSAILNATIGRHFHTDVTAYFKGQIDEFVFYKRALTDSEIVSDYNSFLEAKFVADEDSIITGVTPRLWQSVKVNKDTFFNFGTELGNEGKELSANTSNLFDEDLIGLWHLNGDTLDSSDNSYSGTNSGANLNANGLFGTSAGEFDGLNSFISADVPASSFQNGFSLSGWIYPVSLGVNGYGRIFDKSTTTSGGNGFYIYYSGSGLIYSNINNGGARSSAVNAISLNRWQHVVVTVAPNSTISIYVNGVLSGTPGTSGALSGITTTNPFTIGNRSNEPDRGFDGKIEEVALWNRDLSSTEVSDLYSLNASRFHEPSILALWHLNENTLDSSGNGFNGDWNGTPSYETGLWDSEAGNFSGTTGQAINVSGLSSSTSVETISFWAKTTNWNRNGNIFNSGTLSFSVGTHSGDPTCGSNKIVLNGFGSGFGTTAPPTNEWTHIVVLRGVAGLRKIYYNGLEQETVNCTGWGTYAGSVIGARRPEALNTYFLGQLEDLTLFTKRLTEQEIIDLYRKGATRLDLNLYSCTDEDCQTKTDSQYLEGIRNNTTTNLSISDSTYLGYEAYFKPINELSSESANKFWINSFLKDVTISAISANNAPTINLNSIENYSLSESLPYFSHAQDGNLNFDFNVRDLDNDRLLLTVRFSTTTTQGSGTELITDLNLDSTYCDSENFSSLTNCSVDLNTLLISDGNYYLLAEINDSLANPVSENSTDKLGLDNTPPTNTAIGFSNNWQRGFAQITINCSDAKSGCLSNYYRYYLIGTNPTQWVPYSSFLTIKGDGNYQIDINSVDAKGNWSNLNTYYVPIGFDGDLKTFNDSNKPRSFFSEGETVRFIYDINLGITPTITITDSTGTTVEVGLMQNITADSLFGNNDLNTYYYDYTINGANGWLDINIENQFFEKQIYNSIEWQNKFTDNNGIVYPFTFDINVTEPNVTQRWFNPIDVNISFITPASISSIKVLDYNGTTYKEIPSQLYDINYSSGFASSGRLAFLDSFDINETKQFFVNYSIVSETQQINTDINTTLVNSIITMQNSIFSAHFDINEGGLLQKIKSKIGTNTDFNSETQMQSAPKVYSRNTYSLSNTNIDSLQITSGSIVSKITIAGNANSIFDYNINYLAYSKNNYITFDSNLSYLSISPMTVNSYLDNDLYIKNTTFDNYTYLHNNSFTHNNLQKNGSSSSENDLNLFALYNKKTLDSFGIIYDETQSSKLTTNTTTIYDSPQDTGYTKSIFSGDSIIAGDYFYSKNYYFVFNSVKEENTINRIFNSIKNPMQTSIGESSANDFLPPIITSDANYNPLDLNDSSDINCFASFNDDVLITTVLISITGPNLSTSTTQTFNNINANASVIIPAQSINSGNITCAFTATDIAGQTISTQNTFFVKDYSAPQIIEVSYSPDTNAGIDPDTNLLLNIKLNEYTGIDTTSLFHRKLTDGNWSDWNSSTLINDINYSDTNYGFTGNLQLSEGTWQFFVNSIDVNGFDSNSEIYTIYAYLDYTWLSSPSSFGNKSGQLGNTMTIGTILINNSGDVNLTYKLKSNWDNKYEIFYDLEPETTSGHLLNVDANTTQNISVSLKTKTTERSDNLIITVDAINSQAEPDSNTITATILSLTDGPFLLVEWVNYDTIATQEDTNVLMTAIVTNLGNSDANNVILDWNFPTDWTIASGNETSFPFTLAQEYSVTNSISFNINSNASTGNKEIIFEATCCGLESKTQTLSTTTTILAKPSTPPEETGGTNTGNPGGGSGGTGGASPFGNTQQKDLFFQTNEFFEIVRGQDNEFEIKFTNPLQSKLVKIKLEVTGILATYLTLKNNYIAELDSNQEYNTTIQIESPKYFNPGQYELTFNINGYFLNGKKEIGFNEQRQIQLLIHDTNKQTAENYLTQMQQYIMELNANNYKLNDMPTIINDANELYKDRDYDGVKLKFEEAQKMFNEAIDAAHQSKNISGLIGLADTQGLETPNTNRLLSLAQLAFQRGDYALALSRLKEAELTYSLETKGELNLIIFALANLDKIILITILGILAIFLFSLGFGMIKIDTQLKQLNQENGLILTMIADTQRKSFVENKISLGEYYDALNQFEKRIAEVSEKIIQLTTRKTNILTFSTQSTKLKKERRSLIDLVKDTQKQYFTLGLIETRLYQTKVQSLTKRLSEVDEQIVTNDLTKTIRINQKGIKKYFWKLYYTIFK